MGPVDELLCAGDAVYQFRFSNEVLALLRERNARYVLGNHEEIMLGKWGERARSAASVRKDLLAYMQQQPYRLEAQVNGKRLLMVHGSPFEEKYDYLYPNASFGRFASLDYDYVILGHTHFALTAQAGKTLIINPGSCGEPRDHRNGFQVSAAVLDTASGEVTWTVFPDPTRPPAVGAPLTAVPSPSHPALVTTPQNVAWWDR
jgi:putative phosphoesterase